MSILLKFVVSPVIGAIIGRGVLAALHHWGFYPDIWLAGLIMTAPGVFQQEISWVFSAVVALILTFAWHYFHVGDRLKAMGSADSNSQEAKSTQKDLPIEQRRARDREQLLAPRSELERAVADAEGAIVVAVIPDANSTMSFTHNDQDYVVPVTKCGWDSVWVSDRHEAINWLAKIGDAKNHEQFDVRNFQKRESISLRIGECAILEMSEGDLLQLLLVAVQYENVGDPIDQARFRYRFYEPGAHLLRALRNGEG